MLTRERGREREREKERERERGRERENDAYVFKSWRADPSPGEDEVSHGF